MYLVPEGESYFHWVKMVEIRHIFRILVLKSIYLFFIFWQCSTACGILVP